MKIRENVIKNRECGLKKLDNLLTVCTIYEIIEETITICNQFPDIWGGSDWGSTRWGNVHWGFHNALYDIYDKRCGIRKDFQFSTNLDECLSDEQIKYIADKCNITDKYEGIRERKIMYEIK